jgi:hypothetical protein
MEYGGCLLVSHVALSPNTSFFEKESIAIRLASDPFDMSS